MIASKTYQRKKDIPDSTKVTPELREKCIKEYLRKEKCKELICRPWIRGLCLFEAKDCRYAHGVEDLFYVDPSELPPDYEQPKVIRSFKMKIGENFNGLIAFQLKLVELGELRPSEVVTVKEIENDKDIRKFLREQLRKHETYKFLELLFEKNKNKLITRSFLDQEAERVGLYPVDVANYQGEYYYQLKINNENAVFKCDKERMAESLEKKIILISKELLANGQSLPIPSDLINKNYHKYCSPTEPLLYQILKILGKNLEWILYQLELKSETKSLLGVDPNYNEALFISQDELMKKKLKLLTDIVRGFWIEKGLPASKYETFYNYILKHFPDAVDLYGTEAKFTRILKKTCLREGSYIIYFASQPYLINPSLKALRHRAAKVKCEYEKVFSLVDIVSKPASDLSKHHILAANGEIQIFVVDDRPRFEESIEMLRGVTDIAIDLEGQLRSGSIELLQIGMGGEPSKNEKERRIIIFDLLTIQKCESLLKDVKVFLRNLLGDEKISKTFQDCRTDSKALHRYLNSCPKGIFDISAAEILVSTLRIYVENQKIIDCPDPDNNNDDAIQKVMRKCEDIKWPGLNDILLKYNATHGLNIYKNKMKKMFGTPEHRPYFLARPIEHDYLHYSAQDVQDLVEVKYKMLNVIEALLNKLNLASKEVQELILSKIFKSYSSNGCRKNE